MSACLFTWSAVLWQSPTCCSGTLHALAGTIAMASLACSRQCSDRASAKRNMDS